jgi:iron complex outermembrane receptor protein
MDPPLHYAPTILLESISVTRGSAPVSAGPGMGAAVDATLKQVGFGTGDALSPVVDLAASYRTADEGIATGGIAGLASERWRLGVIGAYEEGEDYRIPGGRVADTAYQRQTYGMTAGYRGAGNTLSLDLRRQETGASGNPPFAMDIEFFDTDFARAGFDGTIAGAPVALALGYTGVAHAMNNYALRPAPDSPTRYRRTLADADTFEGSARVTLGPVTLGGEFVTVDRMVTITNPNNAAFVINSLDKVQQERFGGFAEVSGSLGGWQGDLGVRVDHHRAQMADPHVGAAVPAMVQMLAQATAADNRLHRNTTVDVVARVWHEGGTIHPRLVLSRKTRVPNAVERFSWLPTEASGGLADGNIYIGDQSLKPEVAYAAEAGFDVTAGALRFRPSAFYRRIDDYIQGTPVPMTMMAQRMIAAMNGDDTPLIFTNVDAELYGFDGDFGWQASAALRFDATVSYVRGKRRDIADNLYRIAPLNGRASVTYGGRGWSVTGEVVAAAAQRKVSVTNEEEGSGGWASANLWFDMQVSQALHISGGIENLFDRTYANHLSGRNRVAGSDVAVGERLLAVGRSGFLRVGIAF